MRPTPAGRGGTARCCSPYNAILERLDTMDTRIQQAVDDANAAMSAAVIQAGNAAQSASDALTQAGIAAGKASDAAADAADAAQDAADAAQALSDINDTIGTILNSTLGDKVDKLTTAGLHLYSHTGSTQGEEEPIDGTTSNTIPIRDGNGRMQAADPASGATDKTLTTANWVSQTGDSSPNNLVHRSGNETILGNKTFDGTVSNSNSFTNRYRATVGWTDSTTSWTKMYEYTTVSSNRSSFMWLYDVNSHDIGLFMINGYGTNMAFFRLLGTFDVSRLRMSRKNQNLIVWVKKTTSNNRIWAWIMQDMRSVMPAYTGAVFMPSTDDNNYTEPIIGVDYDAVITPTAVNP